TTTRVAPVSVHVESAFEESSATTATTESAGSKTRLSCFALPPTTWKVPMQTVEMAEELELRRLRFFIRRLEYLRSRMAGGEQAMLDGLLHGATPEFWEPIDRAIDALTN